MASTHHVTPQSDTVSGMIYPVTNTRTDVDMA